ncbi:rod shape-determining protein, partial [Candidatus Gottesmanbacteria bacterium]|nr:rod shape-determining protein [Candidatus Gottesmanbacteria bacterium]
IGERMAETIKVTIGDAMGDESRSTNYEIRKKQEAQQSSSIIHNSSFIIPDQEQQKQKAVGSIVSSDRPNSMEVRGRDLYAGLPRMIELTRAEVTEAIMPILVQIVAAVKAVLEDTPPELAADIIDKGIVMAGGTSTLRNMDKLMTQLTGVPCHVAEDALLCVVRGTGVALENIELYKRSISRR